MVCTNQVKSIYTPAARVSRSNTQIMARREDEKGKDAVVDLTNESDDEQHQDVGKIELGSYDCQVFYCAVPEA